MRGKSIRSTFFSSITTVLVASVLVMGMLQTYTATNYFRVERQRLMREVVEVIAGAAQDGHLQTEQEFMTMRYMAQVADADIYIVTPDGTVSHSVGGTAPTPGTQVSAALVEGLEKTGEYLGTGTVGGLYPTNYFTSALRLPDRDGQPGGYVFASSDSISMRVYLLDTMSTYIMSAGLVLLVSSLLALALSNRMVIPIRRLSDAAKRFGEGDYSARVPVEGEDELTRLAVIFNNMADSFEATDVSRRSFMGNIAHELRTPMTTIKGFIDGMLDGTIPVEQRDKYLLIVSDEVGRLARLTKNMLDISRLEAGETTPNLTTFDLWKPITQAVLAAEQRLEEKGLTVEGLEGAEPVMVQADEDFTHQVVFNLIDNAIKFAAEGGVLSLRMEAAKGTVTAGIKNTGAGIGADNLPYIFDRFYKADKSRGEGARGAGLGLHISKVLVGLMGGRIWAESEEGAWTEFLFSLPAAPPKKKAAGPRRGGAKG